MRTRDPWAPPEVPFTLAHVGPMGITPKRLRSALRAGQITRLRHGVYVASAAVPDGAASMHVLRARAEQLAIGDAVASHQTAALALDLPMRRTGHAAAGPVHLTQPSVPGRRSRLGAERRIHVADVPTHHVVTAESGLVVTSPARTARDLAVRADLPEALMVADAAVRHELRALSGRSDRRDYGNQRLVSAAIAPLREAILGRSGRAARSLQDVLAFVDARRESPLESFSAGHMHLAGLPAPIPQAPIRTAQGVQYPDFLWEEFLVIGEADGEGKYADSSAFAREKEREIGLQELGFLVVRWTGKQGFAQPGLVIDRLARALMSRGWSG